MVSQHHFEQVYEQLLVTQPDGSIAPFFFNRNVQTAFADATGIVSFTYTPMTTPVGTWRNVVRCTFGSETLVTSPTFTVP